jgi:hypothetical protein
MTIEQALATRMASLLEDAGHLRRGNEHGQVRSDEHLEECGGWIAAALNVVQIACPNEGNAYRKRAEAIAARPIGYTVQQEVGEFSALLKNLVRDIEAGLLTSIADRARAETFDDFLDHGRAYLSEEKKQEAGVICGVVFEDTLRRVCRKHEIDDKDVKLDTLISALVKIEVLSDTKAKRARGDAHVRTKATHAQWDEFDLKDVAATIDITQELISAELDK